MSSIITFENLTLPYDRIWVRNPDHLHTDVRSVVLWYFRVQAMLNKEKEAANKLVLEPTLAIMVAMNELIIPNQNKLT